MFGNMFKRNNFNEQEERAKLANLSEKELLIEIALTLKKIDSKCDDLETAVYSR